LDDRRRAIDDNDSRAVTGGPPAPDPTHIGRRSRKGFTGLEAFWNYQFWQSESINGYDNFSHLLRVNVFNDPDCSALRNEIDMSNPEDKRIFDKCTQWLGPNLPGITTPDFTSNQRTLAQMERQAKQPASHIGERRQPGQLDAGPLPGQSDISKPQLALPPGVKPLLDQLSPEQRGGLDSAPSAPSAPSQPGATGGSAPNAASPGSAQDLLDFLLGS
jgi:hypothetical protein